MLDVLLGEDIHDLCVVAVSYTHLTLVQLFSGALSIVGTLGLMLYTNVYLTVITLLLIPLMLKAGGAVASRSQKYFNAQQSALGALNGYIEETISGQKAVKVFCHEDVAEEEFEILNSDRCV